MGTALGIGLGIPFSLGGSAAPYSPDGELFGSGEAGLWYDPSDFSTMFQDTAGTTPVTTTGQLVARINDKSGNGINATQATGASRPTLQQDGSGYYYLNFDGIDDSLTTSSMDMTGTDAITVIAGIRKASDAALMMLYEFSANMNSNNGAFASLPSYSGVGSTLGAYWNVASKGTALVYIVSPGTFAAPATAVQTHVNDISAPVGTLRINKTQEAQLTSSQGTGNYGNHPLYIGRRGGSSLPFNGRLYSMIVRGALTSGTALTDAEDFVNSKTGAY